MRSRAERQVTTAAQIGSNASAAETGSTPGAGSVGGLRVGKEGAQPYCFFLGFLVFSSPTFMKAATACRTSG